MQAEVLNTLQAWILTVLVYPGLLFGVALSVVGEWVFNAADIDGSPIVWARDRGEDNARLRAYFAGRKFWLLEPDASPDVLIEAPRPDRPRHVARAQGKPESGCPRADSERIPKGAHLRDANRSSDRSLGCASAPA